MNFFVLLANHIGMAKSLKYPAIKEYRYWDYDKRCVDIEGMLEDLRVTTLFWLILRAFLQRAAVRAQCSHCKRCTSYSSSVCLSVCLSVCHTPVLCQNDSM